MQVAKGGWVGQTFALAKLNDFSGGKKSKNRHSKEERKGMVETFIKRYQASNNGNFPSLRLTQKEVGGSFYTVREIFREIIQENRVLAPPKLPPGDHNMENLDSFLEHYRLGSVSVDPHLHMVPPKDIQTLLDEYEFRRQMVLNSRKITELQRGNLDNNNIINESTHTTVKNEEFKDEVKELEVKELEANEAQIRPLSEGVVVETFPLRPVSNTISNSDEKTSRYMESETGKDESYVHDDSTEVVDTKSEEEIEIPKTQNHLSTEENVKLEDTLPAEYKVLTSPKGVSSPNLDCNNSSNSLQQLTNANRNRPDIRVNGFTPKQTNGAALNRINLESWEAEESEKSNVPKTSPTVSFIKSLVTAFVKFWSE